MEGIGERLKRKREEMGLSIEQAAEATKFRPELIEAVEEGRPGLFNAPVYQDGFIRGYARMLGLDGDALVREQKSEEERAQEALRGIRVRPPSTSKLRRTAVVVIAIAAVGVLGSILIDRMVTRPREPREEASSAREATAPAPRDSVARSTSAAASREMDYIPEPPQDEAARPAQGQSSAPGSSGSSGSLGGVSVADLYNRSAAQPPGQPLPGAVAPGQAVPAQTGQGTAPGQPQAAAGSPAAAGGGAVAGQQGAVRAGPGVVQPSTGSRSLEVAVGRHSVYLILASGQQVIYDGWVYGGMRKMFKGDEFVIVSLSSVDGVSLTLDGRPVALPEIDPAGQKSIGDWPVR